MALAGETESRNVQTRVDMTPSERMKIPPIDTEDIERTSQIVRQEPGLATPYRKKAPYNNSEDFLTY